MRHLRVGVAAEISKIAYDFRLQKPSFLKKPGFSRVSGEARQRTSRLTLKRR
jgi:hypothetical protein